jgi:hypothetical protein
MRSSYEAILAERETQASTHKKTFARLNDG